MHRSYNSYTPVASKLLQKRWDDKYYNVHRQMVHTAKPQIDSEPPVTFMHLHLKLKKLQLEEERLATIERDNRILLEKMSHTARTKGQIDNKNEALPKSLSRSRRERELLRITRENLNMFKRIASKKPEISREKMEKDWQKNLVFMDNISAFPDEWWTMNRTRSRRRAQSRPNESRRSFVATAGENQEASTSNNNNNNNNNNAHKKSSTLNQSTSENKKASSNSNAVNTQHKDSKESNKDSKQTTDKKPEKKSNDEKKTEYEDDFVE